MEHLEQLVEHMRSKNHFVSYFLQFEINTTILFLFFTKWLPAAILDVTAMYQIKMVSIKDLTHIFHTDHGSIEAV